MCIRKATVVIKVNYFDYVLKATLTIEPSHPSNKGYSDNGTISSW